jgi:Rrf2 family nitric oxide-sensitive transcriptional repressor
MRLTTFSDYTLRVLIYLGLDRQELATIAEIADAYGISKNHLMKVVNELGARGYVETVRGKGGGLRLKVSPSDISLGEVLRESEADTALVECFDRQSSRCCIAPACSARGILRQAQEAFYKVLDDHTLADLLQPQQRLSGMLLKPEGKRRKSAGAG